MLQEHPDELVQSSIESFEIQPDLQTLDRINENVNKLLQKRAGLLNQYESINKELKELISKLDIESQELIKSDNYPQLDKTEENVFKSIEAQLDHVKNLKVSITKNLSDLNVMISSNTRSKLKLNENLQQLNETYSNVIDDNMTKNQSSSIMKLNLYKDLGLVVESSQDSTKPDKILIFNEKFGASNFLKVDEQYSDYFITNYIWDKL